MDPNDIGKLIKDKKAKEKYNGMSDADKFKMIQGTKELQKQSQMYAAKVVHDLYYLTCNKDEELKTELDKVLPFDKVGYMLGGFKDTKDKPVFQLYIVPKEYNLEVYSPPRYVQSVYNALGFLLQCAQMYHVVMAQTNPQLINRMRELRPDVDFMLLKNDEKNKSTLYFDANLDKRIGVSCIWIDEKDNIIGEPNKQLSDIIRNESSGSLSQKDDE